MVSVTTYSLISSRRISSSVWSTLMTSSMRRLMSLAKSVFMDWVIDIGPLPPGLGSSEDLRAVVVLGVKHAHEAQTRCAIEVAGVEENRRNIYAALQLLEEREGPVDREKRPGSQDEDDVLERIGILRHPCCDEVDEWRVLGQY